MTPISSSDSLMIAVMKNAAGSLMGFGTRYSYSEVVGTIYTIEKEMVV